MSPMTTAASQPIHCAIRDTGTLPAMEKMPAGISAAGIVPAPGPSISNVVRSSTLGELIPLPSADHDVPFQRAILFALTPPARLKLPAAKRAGSIGPAPSS